MAILTDHLKFDNKRSARFLNRPARTKELVFYCLLNEKRTSTGKPNSLAGQKNQMFWGHPLNSNEKALIMNVGICAQYLHYYLNC